MHMCRENWKYVNQGIFYWLLKLFLINSEYRPINGPLWCGLTVWTSCLCTVYLVYTEHRLGLPTTLGFLYPNHTHRAKQTLSLVNDTFADVATILFTSPMWLGVYHRDPQVLLHFVATANAETKNKLKCVVNRFWAGMPLAEPNAA